MREIKFRAWDVKDQRMVYNPYYFDVYHYSDENRVNQQTYRYYEDWRDLEDGRGYECELMQYTGLKDKNSKEIYEGDVIRKENPSYWNDTDEAPDAEDMNFYRGGTAQVVAIPFGFYMQEIDCGEWCFNGPEGREWAHYEIQVIGNIYENPELLKDETKS